MNAKKREIDKWKWAFIGIYSLIVTIILIFGRTYYNNYEQYKISEIESQLKFVAEIKVKEAELFIEKKIAIVSTFHENKMFYNFIDDYVKNPAKQNDNHPLSIRLGKYYNSKIFDKIILFNQFEKKIISFPDSFKQLPRSIKYKILSLRSPHDILIPDPYIDTNTDKLEQCIVVFVYKNITDEYNFAKLVCIFNPEELINKFYQYPNEHKTAEVIITKKVSKDFILINNTKFDPLSALKRKILTKEQNQNTIFHQFTKSGIYRGKDYRDKDVIAYTIYYHKMGWQITAKIDKDEIQDFLIKRLLIQIFIMVLLIVIIGFLFYYFLKSKKMGILEKRVNLIEELELNTKRLNHAEFVAGFGNWEINLDKKISILSKGACKIFGLENSINSIDVINNFALDKYRISLDKEFINLTTLGKPYDIEFKIKRITDGQILDIHAIAEYDKEANKIYGVMHDITNTNEYKNKIQKTEERLRLALEATSDGVWDLDLTNQQMYWNERAFSMLGYTNNEFELSYDVFLELIHPLDREKTFANYTKILEKERGLFRNEFRLKQKNGDYIWILGKGKIVESDFNGKPTRIVGTNTDINERKLAEIELEKIEWMLRRGKDFSLNEKRDIEYYSDRNGLIYESITENILKDITGDYIMLTESSSVVYEKDGSYAMGVFASDWCKYLRNEKNKLCKNLEENKDKIHHCDCCKYLDPNNDNLTKIEITSNFESICNGGINIFTVPIYANKEIIGAISLSYSEPPNEMEKIKEISQKFALDPNELKIIGEKYYSRPGYIIEMAKERIASAARLIGALVERSISEKALFENQEKYKSLIESSDSIIVMIDRNYKILYINKIAANYFQQNPEAILNRYLVDIFPVQYFSKQLTYLDKVFETGERISEESEIFVFNSFKWLRSTIYPVRDSSGNIFAALVNASEVTELKNAEEQRKQSEEKFKQFMQYSPNGVLIKDSNGNVIYVNDYMEDNFNAGFWLGKTAKEILPGEIGDAIYENDISTLVNKFQSNIELLPHKSGKILFYEVHRFLIERENTDPLIGNILTNITEKKLAEESLKSISLRQEAILSTTPDLIAEIDLDGFIRWSNKAVIDFFGENIKGESVKDLMGEDGQILDFNVIKILNENEFYYYETKYKKDEGEISFIDWRLKKLSDDNKELIGYLATGRDITEQKKYEESILSMNAELDKRVNERTFELKEANKELEAFTYTVSHDLRSPLRAIDGFSRIILEDYSDIFDKEGLRLFNVIRDNTKKMDQLITDLLSLSRITKIQVVKLPIKMNEFITSIYEESVSEENKSKFNFIINPLIDVSGDSALLKQVVVNLISNAIKYTLPKGKRIIEIGCYKEDNEVVYFVKDTGVGFNMDYVGKLFGVFQRLHRMEEFEGTGVGLAIIKRIIEKHGGRVWAEGKIDEGATFYFSLPLYNDN